MNYTRLKQDLYREYEKKFPRSREINTRACRSMVDGGSHAIRLLKPFPPRITKAGGAFIYDEDGHGILDFWQGHHANILGHNPDLVTGVLADAFLHGSGLQTGFTDALQAETAELLAGRTGAEKVRFTTSGALATMYAVLLARAYTGRTLVMKIGGGWHGAQPWGLKGVEYHHDGDLFQHVDSAGLSPLTKEEVLVIPFNDTDSLKRTMEKYGDDIACFIMEPFIGAGGFFPVSGEFIGQARSLTEKYGTVLILDEVISGFRFCAGSVSKLYGVQPDLATLGKIVGGGMPLSAVAGRSEIMKLAGSEGNHRVKFSGGTYSAHPASLLAAGTMIRYLIDHEDEIYPAIGTLGEDLRRRVERCLAEEGLYACCTGYGNDAVQLSSLAMLFFPHEEGRIITLPWEARDPAVCDTELGNEILQISMLLEGVHVFHGLGSLSTAHTEDHLDTLEQALRLFARRVLSYR